MELDVDVSELDDESAEILSTCLYNIEMLKLREMTLEGARRICDAINRSSKPVL